MSDALPMWVIYEKPSDHSDKFVARKWLIDKEGAFGTDDMFVGDSLDEVRGTLPPGLTRLPRAVSDDPVIVETWL